MDGGQMMPLILAMMNGGGRDGGGAWSELKKFVITLIMYATISLFNFVQNNKKVHTALYRAWRYVVTERNVFRKVLHVLGLVSYDEENDATKYCRRIIEGTSVT